MYRPPTSSVLLLGPVGLLTATVLCGCLSLSFGGKHEHLEPTASATTLLQHAATSQKLEDIESRLRSLEHCCKNCDADVEPTESGPSKLILTPLETP